MQVSRNPARIFCTLLFWPNILGIRISKASIMMPGKISPGRRKGTFDRECCSTEAVLNWDGIAAFWLMGVSDDDREAEEEGDIHRIGGVGIGDDRGDDDNWILLNSVRASDRQLGRQQKVLFATVWL
jgi:hypothetical protein